MPASLTSHPGSTDKKSQRQQHSATNGESWHLFPALLIFWGWVTNSYHQAASQAAFCPAPSQSRLEIFTIVSNVARHSTYGVCLEMPQGEVRQPFRERRSLSLPDGVWKGTFLNASKHAYTYAHTGMFELNQKRSNWEEHKHASCGQLTSTNHLL